MNSHAKFLTILAAIVAFSCVIMAGQVGNYYISEEPLSWDESKEYCEGLGQKLLSIPHYEADRDLMDTVYNDESVNLPGNIWVSGREISEGVWNWDSDGRPFYHTRWFVGQPDDVNNLNCVYLASTALFYWRDANCSAPMYFACEP